MGKFCKVGFQGKELMYLNCCWMWLQVITLAEMTDGMGHMCHLQSKRGIK